MNENFKTELAAFTRDVKAICMEQFCCVACPFSLGDPPSCAVNYNDLDLDAAIAAVEAYRKRKKPCAEVIDKAMDVYTIEVEVERSPCDALMAAEIFANGAKHILDEHYMKTHKLATVRVLSAKRFVMESHREDEE